jgi:acetylornithine deacetylase/succinyl-diaminopimelate desuccinylase-like protein
MADRTNEALSYAHDHRDRFLEELIEFGKIPSISTDPDAKADIERAADWVANHLKALSMEGVTIFPTNGHPIVYAELNSAGIQAPTLLIYGHYDVQPADPLELWKDDPFTPSIHGDNIFGRGISDMKGQVMASLKAVESIKNTVGMPINLKIMIEGEEEIGSPNIVDFMSAHKDMLSSDL